MSSLRGCIVIPEREFTATQPNFSTRTPISGLQGARDLVQSIHSLGSGRSPSWRNPESEEVLFILSGFGRCTIEGFTYPVGKGTGIYVPPGSRFQFENEGPERLQMVSVRCPGTDRPEEPAGVAVPAADREEAPRRTVEERNQESVPTGNRSFKVLVDSSVGCRSVTQFLGNIPPGRAPMHHHSYEEAILILRGEGVVWTEGGSAPFAEGTSIYLPRGLSHCLENNGRENVLLLGVFHPSGNPAARYEDGRDT